MPTVYKKGMCRLFFLRKFRSFNVCDRMSEMESVVASVLYWAMAMDMEAASVPGTPAEITK